MSILNVDVTGSERGDRPEMVQYALVSAERAAEDAGVDRPRLERLEWTELPAGALRLRAVFEWDGDL